VCCHLCGRWFRHLGAHIRVHGLDAAGYRERLGLLKTGPLAAADVSAAIANRQRAAYQANPAVRERFADGQAMARSGRLAWLARRSSITPQRASGRAEQLAAGRVTRATRRDEALTQRLTDLGATDLHSYLREHYAAGASLNSLAQATGLGRKRLRDEVVATGITVRAPGDTTAVGRRSRAVTADAEAAARLATDDLVGWLRHRRTDGWSRTRLGTAGGHSAQWVRWRLEG